MTSSVMIKLTGDELNRRLEQLSLKIERLSLLIEDATVNPSEIIAMDRSKYNDLILCLSRYDELLNSFRETTEDTADEIRGILGQEECCYGEVDADEEIDVLEKDDDHEPVDDGGPGQV